MYCITQKRLIEMLVPYTALFSCYACKSISKESKEILFMVTVTKESIIIKHDTGRNDIV